MSNSSLSSFDRAAFEKILAAVLESRSRPTRLEPFLAREAEWELAADPAIWSYAGRRKSGEAILAYLQAFSVEFAVASIERRETLIEGEQACMRYIMGLRHRGTGRSAMMDCLCFVRVEGGLIVEGIDMLDSAKLYRLRDSEF
jgi:ketosteroid isomerase-like protein